MNDHIDTPLSISATPTGITIDLQPHRRSVLRKAADEVDRLYRIGTTPRRDVSPEDLAWWEHADRTPLRRLPRGDLPPIAQWLRTLAGGES